MKRFTTFRWNIEVTAATPAVSLTEASSPTNPSEITTIAVTSEIAAAETLLTTKNAIQTQTSSIVEFESSPTKGAETVEIRSSQIFTVSDQQSASETTTTPLSGIDWKS